MAYVAILDYVAGAVVGLESYPDASAALAMRRSMYVSECMARGGADHTVYQGATPPSAPAARPKWVEPDLRRLVVRNIVSQTTVHDETYPTKAKAREMYEVHKCHLFGQPGGLAAHTLELRVP